MKLFFDHNLPPRTAELLQAFYHYDYPHLQCDWLTRKFKVSSQSPLDDPVWASTLSHEGGWLVFTRDRAKGSKVMPLPEICTNLKITHVLVADSLGKLGQLKQAIVECWRAIEALSEMTPGSRARLQSRMNKAQEKVPILRLVDSEIAITNREVHIVRKERDAPRMAKRAVKVDKSDPAQMGLPFT